MSTLARRHAALPAPLTGSPGRWVRDFALVGGLQMGLILWMSWIPLASAEGAAFWATAGVLAGALGGALAPLLERSRGVLPLRAVAPAAVGLSAVWGMATLAGASALVGLSVDIGHMALLGGGLGALVFSWFWLAYTVAAVMQLPRWPLLLAAVPATLIGWEVLTWLL